MAKWQKFVLEHGHVGAEVYDDTQMLFPNLYGDSLVVTLERLPNGKCVEHRSGYKPQVFDSVKHWLGY